MKYQDMLEEALSKVQSKAQANKNKYKWAKKHLITFIIATIICLSSLLMIIITATNPITYGKNYKHIRENGEEIIVRFYDNGIMNVQGNDRFYVYYYYIKDNVVYSSSNNTASSYNEDFHIDSFCSIHEKSDYSGKTYTFTCSSAIAKMIISVLFFIVSSIWLIVTISNRRKKDFQIVEHTELCEECGYQLFDDDIICPNCGKTRNKKYK